MKGAWALALVAAALVILPAPAALAVEGDVIFDRTEQTPEDAEQYAPATFPHWRHVIRYRCFVCHPRYFVMKRGEAGKKITGKWHDLFEKGQSCATCHDGDVAFKIKFGACSRCHIAGGDEKKKKGGKKAKEKKAKDKKAKPAKKGAEPEAKGPETEEKAGGESAKEADAAPASPESSEGKAPKAAPRLPVEAAPVN